MISRTHKLISKAATSSKPTKFGLKISSALLTASLALTGLACGETYPSDFETNASGLNAQCYSIVPHVSDAWCQAVQCAPVYASFCSSSEAAPQAEPPAPENNEPESTEPSPAPTTTENTVAANCAPVYDPTEVYTSPDQVLYQGMVYQAAWWTQGDTPDKNNQWGVWRNPQTAPENCNESGASSTATSPSLPSEATNPRDTSTPSPESTPPPAEETVTEPEVTNLSGNGCPTNWRFERKDCSNEPWQNSRRWHCIQSFPSNATQSCDSGNLDLSEEKCIVTSTQLESSWCVNPHPTKLLECGGVICSVPAAGNSCEQRPAGGRSIIETCPTS